MDIVATSSGGINTLFESAMASGVSIHLVPEPGTELEIVPIPQSLKLPIKHPVLIPTKKIVALHDQSVVDITVKATHTLDFLFEMALLNGISITGMPPPGAELEVLGKKAETRRPAPLPELKPDPTMIALDKQSVPDLTIQSAGGMDHLFEMALLNGISVTETPTPGREYQALDANINTDIANYYAVKGIKPATGIDNNSLNCIYAACSYVEKNYWV